MMRAIRSRPSVAPAETVIPFHTKLERGDTILVREANAGDGPLLREGFEQLSDRSRMFRFLAPRHALTEADLELFVHENSPDSFAIGALKVLQSDHAPLGIARYVRIDDEFRTAEFALTVIDEYQRKGVGSLLLGVLAKCAVANGVDFFEGHVHRENIGMIALLENLGGQVSESFDREVSVTVPLFPDAGRYPDTAAGDRFRAAYAL